MVIIVTIKQLLKYCRRILRDARTCISGIRVYIRTGKTPEPAYQAMITLFCMTRGYSSALASWILTWYQPPYKFPEARGVLGNLEPSDVAEAVTAVNENSYYVFPAKLSPDIRNALLSYALSNPCRPVADPESPGEPRARLYDRNHPMASSYWFPKPELACDEVVQKLMADFSMLTVAQEYFGCKPILESVVMWWSTAFSKEADTNSAQMYHFDMPTFKWLNIFIYLTDVEAHNGPHCLIAGTHRAGSMSRELLKKGYVRIGDDELKSYYPERAFIEIRGEAGSIFAVDTKAYHKGKLPESGDRLMIAFTFANCAFGSEKPVFSIGEASDPNLAEAIKQYRGIYRNFRPATS